MLAAALFYLLLFVALFLVPGVALLLLLAFTQHQRRFWRRMGPRLQPFGRWFGSRPFIDRLQERHPRLLAFLGERIDPRHPWGLPATIGAAAVLLALWLFVRVLVEINGKDPLVTVDARLHNTVPLFRSAGVTRFMLALTQAGSPTVLAIAAVGLALLAASWGRPRLALAFLAAEAGSGLLAVIIKAAVRHPRPTDALVDAHAASFPSGHTLSSAVVYGLLASLLLASRRPRWQRAAGAMLLVLLVAGIGVSRLYLGVHWPSDVLGSLALALGCLGVALFFLYYREPLLVDRWQLPLPSALVRAGGIAVLLVSLVVAALAVHETRLVIRRGVLVPRSLPAEALAQGLPPGLPRHSEDMIGNTMEPVSLLFVGSDRDLVAAFRRAGWLPADRPTPVRVMREAIAAIGDRPDPTGPATPAYIADLPQAFTFERPGDAHGGIRRRHHARVWLTSYCVEPGCRTLWTATASYDDGVGLSPKAHLPTHHIDPEIDRERALIVAELRAAGAEALGIIPVVAPFAGRNAAGDEFRTDGRAVVMLLPATTPVRTAAAAVGGGER